jgi:hypothetical protein
MSVVLDSYILLLILKVTMHILRTYLVTGLLFASYYNVEIILFLFSPLF